ncbi:MAG: serine hydrolase domain-containing protein [Brevundimonas sp.]
MRPILLNTGGAVLALALSWSAAFAQAPLIPPGVEASVRSAVDEGGRIGVVIGYGRGGETAFFSYGSTAVEGGGPIGPDTIFEVGSVTKVFTAELLAALALDGAVSLHTPLAAIWPDRSVDPALTLADLATHRAGLPRDIPASALTGGEDAALLAVLDEASGNAAPAYSNAGMAILARALVRETGEPLPALLERSVTGPLGMDSTGYEPADRARLAHPHIGRLDIRATRGETAPIARGAGGLYTTARDLMTFLEDHRGAQHGGAATRAGLALAGVDAAPLGWQVHEANGRRIFHHGGEAEGYQAFIGFHGGQDGVRVVLLTNASAADDLQAIALHLLDPAMPLPVFASDAAPPQALARLTGAYVMEGDDQGSVITLVDLGDGLGYVETGPDGEAVRRARLEAVGPDEFRLLGTPVLIRFDPDRPGRARLVVGDQDIPLVRRD